MKKKKFKLCGERFSALFGGRVEPCCSSWCSPLTANAIASKCVRALRRYQQNRQHHRRHTTGRHHQPSLQLQPGWSGGATMPTLYASMPCVHAASQSSFIGRIHTHAPWKASDFHFDIHTDVLSLFSQPRWARCATPMMIWVWGFFCIHIRGIINSIIKATYVEQDVWINIECLCHKPILNLLASAPHSSMKCKCILWQDLHPQFTLNSYINTLWNFIFVYMNDIAFCIDCARTVHVGFTVFSSSSSSSTIFSFCSSSAIGFQLCIFFHDERAFNTTYSFTDWVHEWIYS